MAEDTSAFNVGSIFGTRITDASGQPFIIIEIHKLIWTLVNNIKDQGDLVVKPFESGTVGPDQYNFVFEFKPAVFADVPEVEGWDVAAERDSSGAIKYLYVALPAGAAPLVLPQNGGTNRTELTYTSAIQTDKNSSLINVKLSTGKNVDLGGQGIPDTTYAFRLHLVQPDTPTLSAPPISVDFVGRRTLLNDGKTDNTFTFAITNMTLASLPVTPPSTEAATTAPTKFTVWFDVVKEESDKDNAWALTTADKLAKAGPPVPTPPSTDWSVKPLVEATMIADAVSPEWEITVSKAINLEPHAPVHFTFSGIKTALDPGVTRMYLRFENLSSYRPGVLIAELEKTPLEYGPTQGKGLYISAGKPAGDTSPPVTDSGLYVHQFGSDPAAIFNGGNVGIGAETPPVARLQIVDDNHLPNEAGTLMLGPGNLKEGVTLRLGCQPGYSWIQSHGDQPLAINPLINNNVGIKTATPGSTLSVAGGMAIGKGYAQKPNVIAENELAVEERIGVGTTTPGSSLSVVGGVAVGKGYAQKPNAVAENRLAVEERIGVGTMTPGSSLAVVGGVAIGKGYAQNTTTIAENYLAVEGRVGIGTQNPDHDLHVKASTGIKLSLEKNGGGQLFLSNATNDNSVQLVATGKDDTPNNHTAASLMWLGGWAQPNPTLPKMVLNATEVEIQGKLTFHGSGTNSNVLEFGAGIDDKEPSAGKIGYQRFTDNALDIVGAGSSVGTRNVKLWDNIYVPGDIWQLINFDQKWRSIWPSATSGWGAWYNDNGQKGNGPSDRRLKTDIQSLPSSLARVRRLSGISFRWNEDALQRFTKHIDKTISAGPDATEEQHQQARQEERDRLRQELAKSQIGVIAQEVEAVLPEAVTTAEDGYKSVNYNHLIALLIEAVKEQDLAVTAQAALVAQQQIEIEQLKEALLTVQQDRKDKYRVATGG